MERPRLRAIGNDYTLCQKNKYAWWLAIIYIYGMIDSIVDANLSEFNQLMDEKISNPTNEDNNEK